MLQSYLFHLGLDVISDKHRTGIDRRNYRPLCTRVSSPGYANYYYNLCFSSGIGSDSCHMGKGFLIGVYLGEHISQHEVIHIVTTATGGALGGVCSLALIRFTIFPFYYIDHHMAESIQHLNENTENLKLLKQTIQGLLDRVQSSDLSPSLIKLQRCNFCYLRKLGSVVSNYDRLSQLIPF